MERAHAAGDCRGEAVELDLHRPSGSRSRGGLSPLTAMRSVEGRYKRAARVRQTVDEASSYTSPRRARLKLR